MCRGTQVLFDSGSRWLRIENPARALPRGIVAGPVEEWLDEQRPAARVLLLEHTDGYAVGLDTREAGALRHRLLGNDKPVGGRGGRRGVRLTRRPCLTPAAMRFIESFDPLVKAACVLRERTFLEAEYKAVLTDAQATGLSSARIATKAEAWRRRRVRKRAREAHTPPMPGFRSTRVADRRRMYP